MTRRTELAWCLALALGVAACSSSDPSTGAPTTSGTKATTSSTEAPATSRVGTTRPPSTSPPFTGWGTADTVDPAGDPVVGSSGGNGGVAGASQEAELTAAATGTWRGDWGTLTFGSDGQATFEVSNCAYAPDDDEPLQVENQCDPQSQSGALSVREHGYGLGDGSGGSSLFDAYVDGQGRLHIGLGDIAEVGPGRTADIEPFATAATLTVEGDSCSWKATGKRRQDVECAWVTRDGVELLRAEVPDGFDEGKTETAWWVHDTSVGLLVSPDIYLAVFEKD